jgi:predicted permease
MDLFRFDLRLAWRAVARDPATSLLVVASLAVAIAGNTTFFGVLRGFILQPFPYPQSDRIMVVSQVRRGAADDDTAVSPADYVDWRQRAGSFAALEAFRLESLPETSAEPAEELRAVRATSGLLELLGARLPLGRGLAPADGEPGAERVAVLSHDLWQRRFAGEPAILGKSVRLDDEPYAVVGVLARDFALPFAGVQVVVPLVLDPGVLPRDRHELLVIGRLRPGVEPGAANAEVEAIAAQLEQEHPETNRGYGAIARLLRDEVPGPTDRKLFTLVQGAMALLLLIACANVASLLQARGQDRQQEFAVRASLGAERWRSLRQLVLESGLLAGAAGLVGLALSLGLVTFLRRALAADVPVPLLPTVDLWVVLFDLGVTAAAALLFGVAPALAATRPDPAPLLRAGTSGAVSGARRRGARAVVVAEITLATVMLSATGLLVRSLAAMRNIDSGFRAENLLTLRVALPAARYADDGRVAAFHAALAERLGELPGVESAAAVSALPRGRSQPAAAFTLDGEPPPAAQPPEAITLAVEPGYFGTMGIPLESGRALAATDRADGAAVAVVSRAFARRYLGGADPLGRRITVEGRSREVVGVVGDTVQTRLLEEGGPNPLLYLPLAQVPRRAMHFVLRTRAEPLTLAGAVRAAVAAADRGLVVAELVSMEEHVARQFVGARILSTLLGGFGIAALLLAALGVYGVVAYAVARCRREIGIRMAVGATPRDVVRGFARQGVMLAGVGIALGVPGVYLVSKAIAAVLAGLFPVAWTALPMIAAVLAATAVLASYLPARRAASLDPASVLRPGG